MSHNVKIHFSHARLVELDRSGARLAGRLVLVARSIKVFPDPLMHAGLRLLDPLDRGEFFHALPTPF